MTNNIKITIIHSSDIILKGVSEIIKHNLNCEVIAVNYVHEIPDYPNILGCYLVIVDEEYFEQNNELFTRIFQECRQTKYIKISNNRTVSSFDCINLYESSSVISLKISDMLNKYESNKQPQQSELSQREIDVLKLIAQGHTNKEIADALFISHHTVITHRKNITEKLGIKSVSGLTVYAAIKKIINIDDLNPSELI